jgi:hypothetical protein
MNEPPTEAKRREQAKARLLEHLRAQKPIDIGPWTRDELYERGEARKTPPDGSNPPARKSSKGE